MSLAPLRGPLTDSASAFDPLWPHRFDPDRFSRTSALIGLYPDMVACQCGFSRAWRFHQPLKWRLLHPLRLWRKKGA